MLANVGISHPLRRVTLDCCRHYYTQRATFTGVGMAYSEKAKAARRCRATRKDGQPCRAYALWGGAGLCAGHTYKKRVQHERGYREVPTKAPPCTCIAYQWPHRPGSGLCNWPDAPTYRSTIPAGTHSFMRGYKRGYRILMRRWGMSI